MCVETYDARVQQVGRFCFFGVRRTTAGPLPGNHDERQKFTFHWQTKSAQATSPPRNPCYRAFLSSVQYSGELARRPRSSAARSLPLRLARALGHPRDRCGAIAAPPRIYFAPRTTRLSRVAPYP